MYKRPAFHGRTYLDLSAKAGPVLTTDAVVSHEGYFAGAEGSYDIQAGDIKKYSLGLGYATPLVGVAVQSSNKLSVYTASYYHRVNSNVEASGRVTWDSAAGDKVLAEVGGKYTLDRLSSAKAKINNGGIAQLSYLQTIRPGVQLGLGLSLGMPFSHPCCHHITNLSRHPETERASSQGRFLIDFLRIILYATLVYLLIQ